MTDDYQDGLRDGEIKAIKEMQRHQNDRLDSHERRLRIIERLFYAMLGAYFFIKFIPDIKGLFL